MTKLFHNTANSDKSEIHEAIKRNYKQNDAILQFMKDFKDCTFNAWGICSAFERANPYTDKPMLITSVRRSLNSLKRNGQIKEVGTAKGRMRMNTTLYQFVSETPLLCKSIPKQIKRTPEHGC